MTCTSMSFWNWHFFFPFRRKREARQFWVFKKTRGARGVADIGRERRHISGTEVLLLLGHMDPRTPGPQAGWSGESVTELELLIAFHCSEASISMWYPKAAFGCCLWKSCCCNEQNHSLGQPRWKEKNWTHFYFYYHRTSVFFTDFEKEPTRYYLNIRKPSILWMCHMLSHVQLFATPWTAACQASLSMEISRPEYWSGLPFP